MTNTLASITYEDDITTIILDDGKVNAFSYDMLTQVHRLLDEVPQKSGALIIKGRNGIFSGGFDLKTIASGDLSQITKMIESGYNLILKLYSFDRPIIAAVSGHAIALGLFVACCSDYRIAIDGKYICHANEVRNNMAITDQIMEILKERVKKNISILPFIMLTHFQLKTQLMLVTLMRLFLKIGLWKGFMRKQKN